MCCLFVDLPDELKQHRYDVLQLLRICSALQSLLTMAFLKNLLSASRSPKVNNLGSNGRDSQTGGLDGTRGPETLPVKMNLEERKAFRRELLYETIRVSLKSRFIAANTTASKQCAPTNAATALSSCSTCRQPSWPARQAIAPF